MYGIGKKVVIVAYGRSAIAKGGKGSLSHTHPVDFGAQVLSGVLEKVPQLDPAEIGDVIVGCSKPEKQQSINMARLIVLRAGLPACVPGQTINRFCSSGLQAIGTGANCIALGQCDVVVAGGVESMSMLPMAGDRTTLNDWVLKNTAAYMPMGVTAENVAEQYHITKAEMDALAVTSHARAAAAQDAGKFEDEIIPVVCNNEDGSTVVLTKDEGIRRGTSMESLSGLKTVFKENGTVTAATSSQVSDGASFVVLMSEEKAAALSITPLAEFVGFAVAGVPAALMGIGPIEAVPKVLAHTGLPLSAMDVIELNEAFAAQAIPCMRTLGMDEKKVNPNGGALALGHPLGATGAILTCKALGELRRTNGVYGLITMCVGGGMGAAGIIKRL